MDVGRRLPDDALAFIRRCVEDRKIYWTYHVNMRLAGRHLTREEVLGAAANYEIIEAYPEEVSAELPRPGDGSPWAVPRAVRR